MNYGPFNWSIQNIPRWLDWGPESIVASTTWFVTKRCHSTHTHQVEMTQLRRHNWSYTLQFYQGLLSSRPACVCVMGFVILMSAEGEIS